MFTTPDKASLKSEMGGVMITGSSLVSLKKWGPEKSRLIKDPVARDQVSCHSARQNIFHRWRGPGDAFLPTTLLYTDCARACDMYACRTGTPRCFHVNVSRLLLYRLLTAQHTFSRGRSRCPVTWSQDRFSGLGYCHG